MGQRPCSAFCQVRLSLLTLPALYSTAYDPDRSPLPGKMVLPEDGPRMPVTTEIGGGRNEGTRCATGRRRKEQRRGLWQQTSPDTPRKLQALTDVSRKFGGAEVYLHLARV
jgi:hypothetical protein